jgi:hypothetical protein
MARPELGEGASYLIASPEDMMKLKTIELLQFPNRLSECCHVGVMTVRLPHDLFDNELTNFLTACQNAAMWES